VSQSLEKVCLEFTELLSHSSRCSSQVYRLYLERLEHAYLHIRAYLNVSIGE
jgi:hypothetical protein